MNTILLLITSRICVFGLYLRNLCFTPLWGNLASLLDEAGQAGLPALISSAGKRLERHDMQGHGMPCPK